MLYILYTQNQNSRLLDDQKEMQLTIEKLKKENAKLKRKTVDPTKFEEWNEDDVINWIFSH